MPLRRLLSTFGLVPSHSLADQDVVMADATNAPLTTTTSFPVHITPSLPTLLGKRRHAETSEPVIRPIPMTPSRLSASDSAPANPTVTPARKRHIFTLEPIDTTPDPTPSTSSELNSPAPTEIALDVPDFRAEPTPEERVEALKAAGIKVRDFAYEPQPASTKAPEVFDPLPSLIATDWHMRNPEKNHGAVSGKALFRLIKLGWLTMSEVAKRVHVREYTALAQYSDRPDDQRYPFVAPPGSIPTPSQRVRMRRNAGFRSHPDDIPDREFFGYDPTGHSDEEQRPPTPQPETEVAEPKVKRRKLRPRAKPLSRSTKPLRKEYSRPEV